MRRDMRKRAASKWWRVIAMALSSLEPRAASFTQNIAAPFSFDNGEKEPSKEAKGLQKTVPG